MPETTDLDPRIESALVALWENEVPCQDCGKPALLRSDGHGCSLSNRGEPPWFKCLGCWKKWLRTTMASGLRKGHLFCERCGRKFHSIAEFSDYREF